jgi:hypothetical protein
MLVAARVPGLLHMPVGLFISAPRFAAEVSPVFRAERMDAAWGDKPEQTDAGNRSIELGVVFMVLCSRLPDP